MTGPLDGLRVVEFEAIGPVPHAVSVLTSLGAEVVRIARPGDFPRDPTIFTGRTVSLDLREPAAVAEALTLIEHADVLLDGYRPGVLERRGLGPEVALERNPRLIFARMTGWGQTGPRAAEAGHDLTYIALTGALSMIGTAEQPVPPLNLVGDYGGGSMMLLVGILAALHERSRSGQGQVIDAAIVDGTLALTGLFVDAAQRGVWQESRVSNVLDGAAPYYRTYRCADDKFVAVGAIEEPFYRHFVLTLGIEFDDLPDRHDRQNWPQLSDVFAARFASEPRDHWAGLFAGTDACVTPVLTPSEVLDDEHLAARGRFVTDEQGRVRVAGAPVFSRSTTGPLGGNGPATTTAVSDVVTSWRTR